MLISDGAAITCGRLERHVHRASGWRISNWVGGLLHVVEAQTACGSRCHERDH